MLAAYFGAGRLGLAVAPGGAASSAVWPASGVAVAAVVLGGWRLLPAVFAGALLTALSTGEPGGASLLAAIADTAEPLVAAVLLGRGGFRPSLRRTGDVVVFVGGATIVATAVGASLGVLSEVAAGGVGWGSLLSSWRDWWLGDFGGALICGAAILVLAGCDWRRLLSLSAAEVVLMSAVVGVASYLLLRDAGSVPYVVLPLQFVLAFTYGQRGAVIGSVVVSTVAVVLTTHGHGPFPGGSLESELIRAQAFVCVGSVTALLVAAAQSERRLAEAAVDRLAESESALAEAQRLARLGSFEISLSGGRTTWSGELYRILGRDPGGLTPGWAAWRSCVHRADRARLRELLTVRVDGSVVHRIVRPDGEVRWVEVRYRFERDEHGHPLRALGTCQDVTAMKLAEDELKAAAETLTFQARHDALTGLPNRVLFLERLEIALSRSRRSGRPLAVIFLDLDDFKAVNDTRGHHTGDGLLTGLSPRMQAAVRYGDTVARLGGDEFVALCEELGDEHDAVEIAQRLTDAALDPVAVAGYEHAVSISAGVVMVRDATGLTADAVLRDADAAMYSAKADGKGRVAVFDQGMRRRALERTALEASLRSAPARGELELVYQPVIGLELGRIVGVEALLRWNHPIRGRLAPTDFLPVAESSGAIAEIGEWVIEAACRQAVRWRDAAPDDEPIPVSVNVSAHQLTRSDLAGAVGRILATTGLPPELLELEVTESTLLEDIDGARRELLRLKSLGVRLVVDHFGTGYSSLPALRSLSIDGLKLDRSFVHSLASEGDDGSMVDAVLSIAGALDADVTAEGVETWAQATRLRRHGCGYAQGFLFAQPGSASELTDLIAAGREPISGLASPASAAAASLN